ncbi:hypothetical protein ABPG74_001753 [Tetrahymena malaccensis]
MSGQSLEDRSLDISINYSGRSGLSGPSAEKAIKKESNTVQVLQAAESNNELNKSSISELSKKERLELIKKNKQKYTFTDKKNRCQSISNTIDVANGLNEFDQWKIRIKFNQDIAQQHNIIAQNEQSPEFKKIKRIVTLKKIRYPKSPTYIASPQNVFRNNANQNHKGMLYEEKSPQQLQNVESIKHYRSNQIENLKGEDLSEGDDKIMLNKSEILSANKQLREEQPLRNILQDPNEMKTSQKFLMRQIYQQQIRAIKSMNKVKNQLEKSKSFAQNNSQIQQQESLSPKNESMQFDLQVLQPRLMSSKRKLSNQEETNSQKRQINNNLSPLNYNKYSINLQKKINQRLSNRSDQRFSNALLQNNKNLSSSNIQEKINDQHYLSNKKNYSQIISHNADYQQKQLITDNSVQQLNSQLQQIINNQEQANTGAYNSQKIIHYNGGLTKKTVHSQIKDISKTLNNASQDYINNISIISHTVSTPNKQNMKKQNLERYSSQQSKAESNLQVQTDSNYDQQISDISPIARVNKTQLSPLSKLLQPATDQHRVFVPYNKQTNLKSYLLQDDQDQIQNNPFSKQIEQNLDNNNQSTLNANQNNSSLLSNLNRFQKYQKQLSSIRKKIIYDQEFYEAEVKAIDMSYQNQLEVKGKQESIKTIDKALPFTNNLIKEKIKNLLHNGSFINPLPHFKKVNSYNPHQPLPKHEQPTTNLIQRIAKQNKSSCKNNPKQCDLQIVNKRKDVRRTQQHQSYIKNQNLPDQPSFESRSPSFINHYTAKSKQSQTIFNDYEIENFNQDKYQQMIQITDESKLIEMKDQLQKYINQKNRTPIHQNFNKNKKLLYQNIQQQQRLDTV